MDLDHVGRLLIAGGVVLALVGAGLVLAGKAGLGRLPGDLRFGTDGVRVYVPLATSLVLSVVATIVVNLFVRR